MTMDMAGAPMWDQRYATTEYVFGTEPAEFLPRFRDLLDPGSEALVVADGEGRNSVYLAEQGLKVTAMDVSDVGVAKARSLAATRGVTVDFRVADILTWELGARHVRPRRRRVHPVPRPAAAGDGVRRACSAPCDRADGCCCTGTGPSRSSTAREDPPSRPTSTTRHYSPTRSRTCDIEVLRSYDARIQEGAGHAGMSALIDLVATKP